MNNNRRDNKNRILKTGESQRKDGRYMFKFKDNDGIIRYTYSWKLTKSDKTPAGRKDTLSLREKEAIIQRDLLDNISYAGSDMTVYQLVKLYTRQKYASKHKTKQKYQYVLNILKDTPFGNRPVTDIRLSEAKLWIVEQQRRYNRSYNTVSTIRNVIKPAFKLAVDDDIIRKNPFDFKLTGLIRDDRKSKVALSFEQEQSFLDFVKSHPVYKEYYDAIFFLFNTGVRISEFAGLTVEDIDFDNELITVDHQLLYVRAGEYKIITPKSSSGIRKIPMLNGVKEVCQRFIHNRRIPIRNLKIDGRKNFLFLNKHFTPTSPQSWDSIFKRLLLSYQKTDNIPITALTPHMCRHTFCSKMAKSGMNPKVLQCIMGHEDIKITLNVYAHMSEYDIQEEIKRLEL